MAIALQVGDPLTNKKEASGTLTNSITVNSGSNLILVVCCQQESSARAISGITFGAAALTKLDAQAGGGSFSRSEIWYLKNPTPSTATITVTYSPDGADGKIMGSFVLTGVDQTTTWRTAVKGTGSAASSSLTVTGVASGDFIIDSLDMDGTGHSSVAGADQTKQYGDVESQAGATAGASSSQDGANGGVMSWTWTTSSPFTHVADALIPAGATSVSDSPAPLIRRTQYVIL